MIREKWNDKIKDEDTVYILGDMAMRGIQEDLTAYVSTLKGHKILVRGNHDKIKDPRYRGLYEEICDYKEMRDTAHGENIELVLCHYPILMWKGQHYGSILLYGHVHASAEEFYFRKCLREMRDAAFFESDRALRAYNVGCMMPYMDYEPRTLAEIIDRCERSEVGFVVESEQEKEVYVLALRESFEEISICGVYTSRRKLMEGYRSIMDGNVRCYPFSDTLREPVIYRFHANEFIGELPEWNDGKLLIDEAKHEIGIGELEDNMEEQMQKCYRRK